MKIKLDLDKWWMRVLIVATVALIIIDAFVEKHHLTIHQEVYPGFYAAVGFIGTVFIVVFSKAIGKFLVRKEDYYG